MESTERPAKLARLTNMRRGLPFMTASAMAALLKDVKESGLPSVCGRKDIRASRTEAIALASGPFGPLIQSIQVIGKSGKPMSIDIISPVAFVAHAFGQPGGFHTFLARKLQQCPCSLGKQWNLLLYSDEVTPGNPLGEARRKLWVVYFSFKELGAVGLQKEQCWFPLLCVKTSIVSQIDDGMSQLTAAILKHIFVTNPCQVQNGIFLKSPAGELHFFAFQMGHILQDGAAHKLMYGCRGDSGTRFCFICLNLVAERAALVQDGETILTCKLHHTNSLKMATDADVYGTIDRLIAKKDELGAADYKLWQQACGFSYSKHGLLFDPLVRKILKPVSSFTHDWMHMILSNGVFATCMHAWLEAVGKELDIYKTLFEYMQLWHLPNQQNCKLELLFIDKKKKANKDSATFKCSASEALSLLPVLAYFIQAVLNPANVCNKESNATLQQLVYYLLVACGIWIACYTPMPTCKLCVLSCLGNYCCQVCRHWCSFALLWTSCWHCHWCKLPHTIWILQSTISSLHVKLQSGKPFSIASSIGCAICQRRWWPWGGFSQVASHRKGNIKQQNDMQLACKTWSTTTSPFWKRWQCKICLTCSSMTIQVLPDCSAKAIAARRSKLFWKVHFQA